MSTKITKICQHCGSEEVRKDAWAEWSVEQQEWVLNNFYDDSYCVDCECDTTIIDKELPDATETQDPPADQSSKS